MPKDGNKKAEELDRLIRETRKNQKDPDKPANPNYREEEDR